MILIINNKEEFILVDLTQETQLKVKCDPDILMGVLERYNITQYKKISSLAYQAFTEYKEVLPSEFFDLGTMEDFEGLDDPFVVEQFVEDWGQSQSELCSNLGYDENNPDIDDVLMDDYFWWPRYRVWFPKSPSMMGNEDKQILNKIYNH